MGDRQYNDFDTASNSIFKIEFDKFPIKDRSRWFCIREITPTSNFSRSACIG